GHIFAVLIATADKLGHVLIHVLGDQRRQWQGTVVNGRPVLDFEDGVGGRSEGADHARVAWAERRAFDELDVAAAPPALAFAAGEVLVRTSPSTALATVRERADSRRLGPVGALRDADLRFG